MKTELFSHRFLLTLTGGALALVLASGCTAVNVNGGPGENPGTRSPGPHPTYVVNDDVNGGALAGTGLIINVRDPNGAAKGDGAPVTGCYKVDSATGGQPSSPGPHPVITINLIANPLNPGVTPAPAGPRRVIVVFGQRDGGGLDLVGSNPVIVCIPRDMPYDAAHPVTVDANPCFSANSHRKHGGKSSGANGTKSSPMPMVKSPGPHS